MGLPLPVAIQVCYCVYIYILLPMAGEAVFVFAPIVLAISTPSPSPLAMSINFSRRGAGFWRIGFLENKFIIARVINLAVFGGQGEVVIRSLLRYFGP